MGPTNVELVFELNDWFAGLTHNLNCSPDTKAYIVNVLTHYQSSTDDLSKHSIILAYSSARYHGNFIEYQKIGDWVLWVSSVYPNAIRNNQEVVQTVGRLSYNACYNLLKGSWPLYEELADNLTIIAQDVNNKFLRIK